MPQLALQDIFTNSARVPQAVASTPALPAVSASYETPSTAIHRMVNEVRGLPNAHQMISAMAQLGAASEAWTMPSSIVAAADAMIGAGMPVNAKMAANLARFGEQLSAESRVNLAPARRSTPAVQQYAYA